MSWYQLSMNSTIVYACRLLPAGYLAVTGIAVLFWHRRQLRDRARVGAAHRHAERERIARCLHDTVLSGLQALLIRMQAWEKDTRFPDHQRGEISTATNQMRGMLIEGRDRIAMLRRTEFGQSDLVEALYAVADLQPNGSTVAFQVTITGEEAQLVSGGFEHVVSIVKEAIVNAFRHAQASRIDVTIDYGKVGLRIVVADDGCGFFFAYQEPSANPQHFGLLGMKERAMELAGQLSFAPNEGRGTQVRLQVPAQTVYARSAIRPPVLRLSN
jgi:signal transduction histidine kinase